MGPVIDHVVFGEVAKVGKDKLGEVSLPNTNLGGTLQRAGPEKPEAKIESRRPLPAISRAISDGARKMDMSSLLAYLTRSSYTRLASASIKSELRGTSQTLVP